MELRNVIPDTQEMNRMFFKGLLQRNPRASRFGFSKKHTEQIMDIRKTNGGSSTPDKLYDLPVEWNAAESFIVSNL